VAHSANGDLDRTKRTLQQVTAQRDSANQAVAQLRENLTREQQQRDSLVEMARQQGAEEAEKTLQDRETALDDRAAKLKQREAAVAKREKAVGIAEQQAAANTISGDGIYLVGPDIAPGTYRSAGPLDGFGYWARLSDTSGTLDGIIANGNPSGPTVVTIRASDKAFETTGMQDWKKIG